MFHHCEHGDHPGSCVHCENKRLRASQERLKSAIEFAHSEGFEWPSDPMAEFNETKEA